MEDARALLDSLMGQTRDAKKDKGQKVSGGNGFKHESVCKLYLVGFCPEEEQLFYNTRRDLGPCHKTHFDVHKREFNEHPDKAKYQAAYEAQLLRHLSSILRRCDEWILREKAQEKAVLAKKGDAGFINAGISKLKEKASKSIADAEELASKGDIEASKLMVNAAREYENKAKKYEEQAVSPVSEICDICGGTKEGERFSAFKHEEGKVHLGILSITKMHEDLKRKEAQGELKVDKDIEEEESKNKEREAKERRAKERDAKEREAKERRAKERDQEREAKEREAKERRANEREAKEREAKKKEDQERDAKTRRQEQAARDRDREARDRRRQDRSRSARRGSDGRTDRSDARSRREGGANRRDRRESSSPRRSGDRRVEDDTKGHGVKQNDGNDSGSGAGPRGDPDADAVEESTQVRFKRRGIEKAFTDLLVTSGAVTETSTYEDLEMLLGDKAAWTDCDVEVRRDLASSFIDCVKSMS